MLRQVFVIEKDETIYYRAYGNALSKQEVEDLRFKIRQDVKRKTERAVGYFDYYKYRIAYNLDIETDLIFIFITGIMDDFFRLIQTELNNFKDEFLKLYQKGELLDSDVLDSFIDSTHKNLRPKIAVVGFSGVGKTTIKNLLKLGKVPLFHIPTISGDIATIKIQNLEFQLFDFAGQEQFKYLWKGFIKGSNAVLIVTESTPTSVERSRFFVELANKEAPYAFVAAIGNKQDLSDAMKAENIQNILGIKAYPMIANKPENRDKMTKIIVDILDMDVDKSPLIESTVNKEDKAQDIADSAIVKENKVEAKTVPETGNYKSIKLDSDLCNAIVRDVKEIKTENILKTHYQMISSTLTNYNDGNEFTYENFYDDYQSYLLGTYNCKNMFLKNFLNIQFSKLKVSIEKEESIASEAKEDLEVIVTALICSYLSRTKLDNYPDFESFLETFKFDVFDAQAVNEIESYYLRILNKFKE